VYLYAVGPALTAGWLAANDLPGIAGSPVRAVCERQLTGAVSVPSAVWTDLAVVAGFAVVALGLGAATLRRRTA